MAVVKVKHYGLCYFCNSYKFGLEQINIRLCTSCRVDTYDAADDRAWLDRGGLRIIHNKKKQTTLGLLKTKTDTQLMLHQPLTPKQAQATH